MPFAFSRPIRSHYDRATQLPFVRVIVPLTTPGGIRGGWSFLFDTGCAITTIGEDVARALTLPAGGQPLSVTGSTGVATGRVVPVRFRFPAETNSDGGTPVTRTGLDVSSNRVVVPGSRQGLALLGFHDVHKYFAVRTTPDEMLFYRWADAPPG